MPDTVTTLTCRQVMLLAVAMRSTTALMATASATASLGIPSYANMTAKAVSAPPGTGGIAMDSSPTTMTMVTTHAGVMAMP